MGKQDEAIFLLAFSLAECVSLLKRQGRHRYQGGWQRTPQDDPNACPAAWDSRYDAEKDDYVPGHCDCGLNAAIDKAEALLATADREQS